MASTTLICMPIELAQAASNITSQHGEDGILGALFDEIGVADGYFVEFGAWDGQHLSNTFALANSRKWRGCYIEGDPRRFNDLLKNVPSPDISKICRYVAPTGPNGLDEILASVGAPKELELLSVDIDSDDLAVWEGLHQFRPLCVVIEYNPTIPFDTMFRNPRGRNWGNSALSIVEFGKSIGYRLIAITRTNLIFVDGESDRDTGAFPTVGLASAAPWLRFFFAYDGTLIRVADDEPNADLAPEFLPVPWGNALFPQPMPKLFRRFAGGDSSLMSSCYAVTFKILAAILRPIAAARHFHKSSRDNR